MSIFYSFLDFQGSENIEGSTKFIKQFLKLISIKNSLFGYSNRLGILKPLNNGEILKDF